MNNGVQCTIRDLNTKHLGGYQGVAYSVEVISTKHMVSLLSYFDEVPYTGYG